MSEEKVVIEPYDESMFDEFVEVVAQDSFPKIDPDDPVHIESMRRSLAQENSVLMAIRDARTREFLGYCDVHDTDESPWEIGIKLLERHWGRGVGFEAMSKFISLLAEEHGQEGFVARIVPDNLASIRLFQKLGATPREVRPGMYMLDEDMAERFARSHPELVNGTIVEMADLFGVAPEHLLGRALMFDVPATAPEPERPSAAESRVGKAGDCRIPAVQNAERRFYASELMGDLIAIKDLACSDETSEELDAAFADLKAKWGL